MKKIAVFGGSFDPFHTDHRNIIKACFDNLHFSEVWIVPTFINPFKSQTFSSRKNRLDMIKLGIVNLQNIKIINYELKKKQTSYTYETLTHLQKKHPNCEFEFIMGSDLLDNFEKWKNFDKLVKGWKFNVFRRAPVINQKIVDKYNFNVFDFDNNNLSSTGIRDLVNLDKQLESINQYCLEHLLYKKNRIEQKMNHARYVHSINVGILAKKNRKEKSFRPNKSFDRRYFTWYRKRVRS